MTRYKERFHQAAREGYLDLLREASKSDSDSQDDNGMTPVMWAAFYGNLDALRLLMSRGGNPDKTDLMGSSALHFAALNGHMPCVSFLVNFGANIWTLDNDLHTALDLASLRDHRDIVDYLDGVASQQFSMNRRVVKRLREKAGLEAQKRIKKYDRLMRKTTKKAQKADRRQQRQEKLLDSSSNGASSSRSSTTNPNYSHSSEQLVQVRQQRRVKGSRAFSEHFATTKSAKPALGVAKKLVGHKRQSADEDGHSQDVLYAARSDGRSDGRSDARSELSGPMSEPEFSTNAWQSRDPPGSPGLFERPGFGSVAFFNANPMTRTLQSLKDRQDRQDRQEAPATSPGRVASYTDSIGTSASLLRRWRDLPWSEEEVENLDDDQGDGETLVPQSELELFLACLGVTEFMHVFNAEQIDLEALGLCHDGDLQDLGLPLGPRKKILEALQRRKQAMAATSSMRDLRL